MNEPQTKWYSTSDPNDSSLLCPACSTTVSLEPMADHHPAQCPNCGIACVFLNWKERIVMILLEAAPPRLTAVLRWLQAQFDELDYVELMCALEELADGINQKSLARQEQGLPVPR